MLFKQIFCIKSELYPLKRYFELKNIKNLIDNARPGVLFSNVGITIVYEILFHKKAIR
jgi:hypothetical protein